MNPSSATARRERWSLVLLGSVMALAIVFGATHLLGTHWAIVVALVVGLALGALALEVYAGSREAPDTHWWDDDSCSGWRGF